MPSPNAASLGKYGDIPVSYYTGVPNIGVPIYTLKEGSIGLPVSLSYHASGVKIGEPSSSVGLGWSLQAGGMISRMIQGRADESTGGFLNVGPTLNTSGFDNYINPLAMANGSIDGEPDIFSFSVGGYSGKFYIGLDGVAVTIPKQDVSIQYFLSSGYGAGRLYKFKIKTPEGVSYEFGDDAVGVVSGTCIEYTQPEGSFLTASGWYLKKITSADSTSNITLSYVAEEYRMSARKSGGAVGGYITNNVGGSYVTRFHHIVQRILGGKETLDNLVLLHPNCHTSVHLNKTLIPLTQPRPPNGKRSGVPSV